MSDYDNNEIGLSETAVEDDHPVNEVGGDQEMRKESFDR
jgi:hypothetical protein